MSRFFTLPFVFFLVSCATVETATLSPQEQAARDFHFETLVLSASTASLDWFTHVEPRPASSSGLKNFEIYSASPKISTLVASFENNQLRQFDLRYYDGPTIRTLTRAGKWQGLRNRLVKLLGPPTRSSPNVPVRTNQSGINPNYAAINAEWDFPKVARRINLIAMEGDSGGVAVVTVAITGAMPPESPEIVQNRKQHIWKGDPGF